MSDGGELQVFEAVDEIPEDQMPVRTRGSKWDAVIEQAQAIADTGRPWLPVERPKGFAGAQAKWLRKRCPGVLVEIGTERIFLKWDPSRAAELAAKDKAAEAAKKEGVEQA